MPDRSSEILSGLVQVPDGDTRLTAGGYNGAVVLGTSGDDTFETAATGGTFSFSFFNGGAGNDRLIIRDVDTVGPSNLFNGGAGIDTLELYARDAITMTNAGNGTTINFANGGSLGVTEVDRYIIRGSANADALAGSTGDDWLDGRGGVDTFQGSIGNDGYVFDRVGESVIGEAANGGIDSIWTTVSVNLNDNANVENLRLEGGGAINGTGNELNNVITGTTGDNIIAGGLGNDRLLGKAGADTFVFAEFGVANRDVIVDFDSSDKIQLDSDVFTGLDLGANNTLSADDFVRGPVATRAEAQIIYNSNTGVLSYDADGTGAGAAQDIAVIGKNLNFFDHNDILLA